MSASLAFLEVANASIEREIRSYFPDTALYRRLSWGGVDGCNAYVQQEFSPASRFVPQPQGTRSTVTDDAAPLRCTSPPLLLLPRKRQRTSLLEELENGLRSVEAMWPDRFHSRRELHTSAACTARGISEDHTPAKDTVSPTSSTLVDAPYAVECGACTTRVVSHFPCSVLKGYVVLWVRSTLDVRCVPVRVRGQGSHSDAANVKQARGGEEKAIAAASALDALQTCSTTEAASAMWNNTSSSFPKVGKVVRSTVLVNESCSSTGADRLQCVLLSLHIVNADAVDRRRPASFALQSVLVPGMPTVLECYPRHMVHFGLLCFAAWHASSAVWEEVVSKPPEHAHRQRTTSQRTNGHKKASAVAHYEKSTSRTSPTITSASFANLLPHTADDAVLILGLGGNVLGQCLDAILPPAVPLHIVEVEPAVLQACQTLHQFPPYTPMHDASVPATTPAKAVQRRKPTAAAKVGPKASFKSAAAQPDIWSQAAELIGQKGPSCIAFSSFRQFTSADTNDDVASQDSHLAVETAATQKRRGRPTASVLRAKANSYDASVRGAYTCYLHDAYTFLRGSASSESNTQGSFPLSAARSSSRGQVIKTNGVSNDALRCSSAQVSVPVVSNISASLKYSIVFLDCYDPDREHMMHEGGLVDLCLRRLRPGGMLLVNAHVLPHVEALERDFLARGFATVQALRVSGCTQTVLVCIAPDSEIDEEVRIEEKCARFTVHAMQQLAHLLNAHLSSPTFPHSRHVHSGKLLRSDFRIDGSWLKSCRRVSVPQRKTKAAKTNDSAAATRAAGVAVDFRVWQHYS